MNYTKEQIIEIAKKVMKDLHQEFYSEDCVDHAFFNEEKKGEFFEKFIDEKEKKKNGKYSVWTVSIKAIFHNLDFLLISDVTGEPIYYQNFNTTIFNIEKTPEGKYRRIDLR